MKEDLGKLRLQLARVQPWVYVAVALALLLSAFYAFQGCNTTTPRDFPSSDPKGT